MGESRCLIIYDISPQDGPRNLIVTVNPKIILRDSEAHEEERCLSVPEYYSHVERSARIKVKYLDLDGKEVVLECAGLLAIAFQHEIDHLDGILFVDHLSPLKKSVFRKKHKKIMAHNREKL